MVSGEASSYSCGGGGRGAEAGGEDLCARGEAWDGEKKDQGVPPLTLGRMGLSESLFRRL